MELPEVDAIDTVATDVRSSWAKDRLRRARASEAPEAGGDDNNDGVDDEFDGDWGPDKSAGRVGSRRRGANSDIDGAGDASAGNDGFAATSHSQDGVASWSGATEVGNAGGKRAAKRCQKQTGGTDEAMHCEEGI